MLRVGVMQLDVKIGDREANQKNVAAWLERTFTPSEHETAIILPEIWDVGYALDQKEKLADPDGKIAAEFLGSLAKKYGVWFVGGSVLAKIGDGYANRAQVIDPNGTLVASYNKVHLIRLMDEEKHFVGGRSDCRFPIGGAQAGCVICYDIRFCEWLRGYALDGTEVLFVSAEWPSARADHWRTLLRARAIENQMYVVGCNRVGTSAGTHFGGGSIVLDPWGTVLFEGGDGEEAGYVLLDTEKVKQVRSYLTVYKDRVPEIYKK